MEVMEPENHAEAVANGAQFLDERFPGWHQLIDKESLDLQSCEACVAGQLGRSLGRSALPLVMLDFSPLLGFDSLCCYVDVADDEADDPTDEQIEESYRDLDREWLKAIDARLKADEMKDSSTQTTKEAIHA